MEATIHSEVPADLRLEYFEQLVHAQQLEPAGRCLVALLEQIDLGVGIWSPQFKATTPPLEPVTTRLHITTRLASAITTLFSNPRFHISPEGFQSLMGLHRWLATIFAASPFQNGDHIIAARNENLGRTEPLTINKNNIFIICLSYYPDSNIPIRFDILWAYDRHATCMLAMALLSNRACPTEPAHALREYLLEWLPARLKSVSDLDSMPVRVLHDVYMHCSYADLPRKHDIKREIGCILRTSMRRNGLGDTTTPPPPRERPVIAVVLEWFTKQHSIYRTHSTTLRALRRRYRVIGMGQAGSTDAVTQAVFDEFQPLAAGDAVHEAHALLRALRPDVIYYPSVGMFPLTMHLVNLRLAPVQLMALGHPATTHSPFIDGVLVEDDYVGSAACFSEPLLRVPRDAMPYVAPSEVRRTPARERTAPRPDEAVRVAVCTSVMKVNPGFLRTLAEATRRSLRPVQFCFYLGLGVGITADYVRKAILQWLPSAEVNEHLPIDAYQAALNSCDLFANPFPFGNTNGLVDTVRQGMPGVCMTGPEVHAHIDEGLFRRLQLPEALIARDPESYVRALLRLVEDDDYRLALHRRLLAEDVELALFRGDPEGFVRVVEQACAAPMAVV